MTHVNGTPKGYRATSSPKAHRFMLQGRPPLLHALWHTAPCMPIYWSELGALCCSMVQASPV
eukprot:CAMPEP_0174331218 /NCGR_PEP_ID=MMETSP0810-20121108/17311_1 /TAXON_ID=73025 ORGANISM="Eutreptiella gymnastica-like, Strain CCMP1594" /NCGR_SAMPLE_ID=MMETSP0810 /ASSEMBLY_ACC=CAM_ASM_000659 /LENGTH=61 /DNA_ID=CAMNT_0015446873 /DNA_START=105 /DNA_END=290 /DNA_ORIENTATION=-